MEFKKKKYSGNSVIMKYEVTNISRIFSRGVIKTILILYTRIYLDQTINKIKKNYNLFSFNNHKFNFLMLVNDEHQCLRILESFSV